MKKIVLAVAALAMIVLGSSCNKTKICHCTYSVNVLGFETSYSEDHTIESGSCTDLENDVASWDVPGITEGSIHCERK